MLQREWTADDYIRMLRGHWVLVVALAVLGSGLAFVGSGYLPKRYQSQAQVLIQRPTVPTDFVKPVASADVNGRVFTMVEQVLSPTGLEPLIRQLGLYQQQINQGISIEALSGALRKSIDFSPTGMSSDGTTPMSGFYVKVTMDSPEAAQQVCSAVTAMFVEDSARRRREQSEKTTQFLAQQITDAKTRLDAEDAKLAAFQSRHIGSLPEEAQTNLNLLGGLTAELEAATQALVRAQQDKSLAESMLAQQIAARQASQSGENPDTFGQQLAALQTKLAELKSVYTDDYPDVVKTKIQIETLKKKVIESDNQTKVGAANASGNGSIEPLQFTQLRAQIRVDEQTMAQKTKEQETIQQQIRSYQERIQSSPAVAQEYKELTRDHQTALDLYNDLLKKRADSVMAGDLEARQEGEQFQVLAAANLPNSPSSPNRQMFGLAGFGGGLALGLGLTFLLEFRDTSVRNERDVELVVQFPVLAVVPAVRPMSRWKASKLDKAELNSALKGA